MADIRLVANIHIITSKQPTGNVTTLNCSSSNKLQKLYVLKEAVDFDI
jgi:hypothetical protein